MYDGENINSAFCEFGFVGFDVEVVGGLCKWCMVFWYLFVVDGFVSISFYYSLLMGLLLLSFSFEEIDDGFVDVDADAVVMLY